MIQPAGYESVCHSLQANPKVWLVTGVAGFIGSHILEKLLALDQKVYGLDDFSTGKAKNLEEVKQLVTPEQWQRFEFRQGSILDPKLCRELCDKVSIVLHQAALGSVPRSIKDPLSTHAANLTGFLTLLVAAQEAGIKRFVYASSSSVYGDSPKLPKKEDHLGKPLSPYAVTKLANEAYAAAFSQVYNMQLVGLRYFNVFGPRQDAQSQYAAVIPRWISGLLAGEQMVIYGDGATSRDFCYVDNAVQANILAAMAEMNSRQAAVYNIACSEQTTLLELFNLLVKELQKKNQIKFPEPIFADFRAGDIRHSLADVELARVELGYRAMVLVPEGVGKLVTTSQEYC